MIKKSFKFAVLPLTAVFFFYGFTTNKEEVSKSNYSTKGLVLYYDVPTLEQVLEIYSLDLTPRLGKTYLGFKEALGFKESGGRYGVVNRFGYMGKYQFGKSTLRMIGIRDAKRFLRSAALQEKAFYANSSRNKWILRKFISYFECKRVRGITVTESGLLAAAHLVGPGAVKDYLRSGGRKMFKDANGTSIEDYMKKFSGYDTSSVFPERRAKARL